MNLEIKDLAGLSEPLKKCIEVISAGLGCVYRPKSIRNDADAKAYEILAIARAEAEAGIITTNGQAQAQLEYIATITDGHHEILERAKLRLISREIEAQNNIEAIAENALNSMPTQVSDEQVSPNWRRKFFSEAENISDENMQFLWGKVLAGEVTKPGSFSLRSLDTLKSLSLGEAETFRLACGLASEGGEIYLNESRNPSNPLKEFGLHYGALMTLTDAGLLHSPSTVYRHFTDIQDNAPSWFIQNNGVNLLVSGLPLKHVRLPLLAFTATGRELMKLIPQNPCEAYLKDISSHLRKRHGVSVKLGKETKQNDGSITISFDEDF